jgi:putative heme iron utilization protein
LWQILCGGKSLTDSMAFEARRLIRAAASATLATQSGGQPFAGLVTPATAPDLSPLLLLSSLSEHCRQLRAEPRCALMVSGKAETANPQTASRVTLTGLAAPVPEAEAPALKARWLAKHPYAAHYADFGDFALWRVTPGEALLVAGFGRITRLKLAELRPDPTAVATIAAAEAGIIAHVNAGHADDLAAIATGLLGGAAGDWRMVAVDVDGADLAAGEAVLRLAFSAPAATPGAVRDELVAATRAARAGSRPA